MFKIFANSWKTPEIRNKILYTLMIFAIVRLGTLIALPGIDTAGVMAARQNASVAGTLYSVIAGGANSGWSLFAMGIGPYINASIIMQLLTIAIPNSSSGVDPGYRSGLHISEHVSGSQPSGIYRIRTLSGMRFHIRNVAGGTDYSKRYW